MKKIRQILLLLFIQTSIAQVSVNKTFSYLTLDNDVVEVEIDTIKYKPQYLQKSVFMLRNESTDESISIQINNVKEKDTINNFENIRKSDGFLDLDKLDGYITFIVKNNQTLKGKEYVIFSYAKMIGNRVILFTVMVPNSEFVKNEEDYKMFARSMKHII